MAYGFNDDKSKANLENQFVVVVDTGTVSIDAGSQKNYGIDLTSEYGYLSDDYIPIGFMQINPAFNVNNVALKGFDLNVSSGNNHIQASIVLRNTGSTNITNMSMTNKILLMRK